MGDCNRDLDFHLRVLSNVLRDASVACDLASDLSVIDSVKRIHKLCADHCSDELLSRVYPWINKLFQRCVGSLPHVSTSQGLLLLEILQFFFDFGDLVLHDANPNLVTFFRSCLNREFADPVVAEATLDFLNANKTNLSTSFPTLLPQFFPLLIKLIAWHGRKLEKSFLKVFPGLISPGSFLPLFPSLIDLPILVVALEKVEQSSGSLVGSSISTIKKSAAPEMLLALMDEAYTGSTIDDGRVGCRSGDKSEIDVADPLFLELLKDEDDGIAERHWTSTRIALALQAAISTPESDRLKQILKMTPLLLDAYFAIALRDVNDSLLCALIPLLMSRHDKFFPNKQFSFEVSRRLMEFMLAAFQRSPTFIAILKKPIIDTLGEACDSSTKAELALQLCWAIGEHGGGTGSNKEAARELFESLELLMYENISTSNFGKTAPSRILRCVVTAIAKLATHHPELLPRARVSLGKVARSRIAEVSVQKHACDCLGLMKDHAICMSIFGPSHSPRGLATAMPSPGVVNWSAGATKMISHVPFYLLGGELQGPPFHDFTFSSILPT